MALSTDFSLKEIVKATRGDKKSSGKHINFIFLKKIGKCFIQKINIEEMPEFFGV